MRVVFDEGVLTGKFTRETTFAPDDFRRSYFAGDRLERAVTRTERVRKELEGTGLKLPEVAIQFALAHPAVSTVIPGIRSVAQAEANCSVSDKAGLDEDIAAAPAPALLAARVLVRRQVAARSLRPTRAGTGTL